MKKFYVTIFLLILFIVQIKAQILTPVHWSYLGKKTSATEAVVFLRATIDPGWHVYSQTVKDGGPIKTTITFNPSKNYRTIGATAEPKPINRYEKVYKMDISFFEGSVTFRQKIKLKADQAVVTGTLEYMTCNDHQCLPPDDIAFSIPVK